jgi:methylglutaconyl-CoA hydratase
MTEIVSTDRTASPIPDAPLVRLERRAIGGGDEIAYLTLNRPQAANALSAELLDELGALLARLGKEKAGCRAVVFQGSGKNFCAGADLAWMKASAELKPAANRRQTAKLGGVFEALFRLPMPTIAVVQGAIYGGAVGLVAACDIALADEQARFCLSEVRWGLVPAVIYPYLRLRVAPGALLRFVLGAAPFSAAEALQAGLVQRVFSSARREAVLEEELQAIAEGEPGAQREFKRYARTAACGSPAQWSRSRAAMAQLLAKIRAGSAAQQGLQAFLKREPPPWKHPWPQGRADRG